MGLLGRLIGRVLGGEENSEGRTESGRQLVERDAGERTPRGVTADSPGEPPQSSESVPDLLDGLSTASGAEKSAILVTLLERAKQQPQTVEAHLPELLDLVETDETAESAAMVLDVFGSRKPAALARHSDRLLGQLDDTPAKSARHLGNALSHLLGRVDIPPTDLVSLAGQGPDGVREPATALLGEIAVQNPRAIETAQLRQLHERGDGASRGAALYLGTLLAGHPQGPGVPAELVADDVIDLAAACNMAQLDTVMRMELNERAITALARTVAPDAHCKETVVDQTPDGSRLTVVADDPAAVGAEALQREARERLGFEYESIEVVETGTRR